MICDIPVHVNHQAWTACNCPEMLTHQVSYMYMCKGFKAGQACNCRCSDMYAYLQMICDSLTHWGRVTHICVGKLTVIGSDNGLSPDRRQAIIWTNAGLLLIGPLGTNFSEILIKILTFSFKKMRLKVSSAKRRPFCLDLNVLRLCLWLIAVWH